MQPSDHLSRAIVELRGLARMGLNVDSFGRRLQLLESASLLAELPAVRAAGPDGRARFEYLVQAINDAIDDLSRAAAVGTSPGSNGHLSEATALRQLFGLAETTRRASWRARQDAAAITLHISWDHFRHRFQSLLLRALAERLLSNAAAVAMTASRFPAQFAVYPSQRETETDTISYIRMHRPPRADLLELSTATTLPILRALRDVGAEVRLLVANPTAVLSTPFMKERIHRSLSELRNEFGQDRTVNLRAYDVPPALRGRTIGSLVAVGWYTYRDNKRLDGVDGGTTEVWGHDNAMVVGETSDPSGAILAGWFGREFDRLWGHRLTKDSSGLWQHIQAFDGSD